VVAAKGEGRDETSKNSEEPHQLGADSPREEEDALPRPAPLGGVSRVAARTEPAQRNQRAEDRREDARQEQMQEERVWRQAEPAHDHQRLALTPLGEAVFRSANRLLRSRLGALLGELRPHEGDQLARLLKRVEEGLGGSPPPRRPHPHPRKP